MTQAKWLPPRLDGYSEWIEYDGTNRPDDDELGQVMFDIEQCEMDFTQ